MNKLKNLVMRISPEDCGALVFGVHICSDEFTGWARAKIFAVEHNGVIDGVDENVKKAVVVSDSRAVASFLRAYYDSVRSKALPDNLSVPIMEEAEAVAYLNSHFVSPEVFYYLTVSPEIPSEWQNIKTGANRRGV